MSRDLAALSAFLRSRRDRITPALAGITAFPGPRRVPGLRREELAVLAGVSPDYDSRLEQGRQPTISDEVLDALARALRLAAARTEPDQRLVVYTIEADSPTALILPVLASWDVPSPVARPWSRVFGSSSQRR